MRQRSKEYLLIAALIVVTAVSIGFTVKAMIEAWG